MLPKDSYISGHDKLHDMLGFLWMLLNTALVALFLVLLFKAAKLLWKQMGPWATLFIVFCLLSFNGERQAEKLPEAKVHILDQFKDEQERMHSSEWRKTVTLEDRGPYDIILVATYGFSESKQRMLPVHGYSSMEGWTGGQEWKPTSIFFNVTPGGHELTYEVNGTIEWSLVNIPVYTHSKTYKGSIAIK